MSARKNPVVRVLAVAIAIVVAVFVVMWSQNWTGATSTRPTRATGTADQAEPSESGMLINLSTTVLELDMTVPAGQGLLDAIGAAEQREGTLSAEQLAAAMALRRTANVISNATVFVWAGETATMTISGAALSSPGSGPSVRDTNLDLVADVNHDGTISVDAGFRMMTAEGQFEVLAEEWGLPLGTRRSASASGVLAQGEGLFMRRRFGNVEILVLVSAEALPGNDDGGG